MSQMLFYLVENKNKQKIKIKTKKMKRICMLILNLHKEEECQLAHFTQQLIQAKGNKVVNKICGHQDSIKIHHKPNLK